VEEEESEDIGVPKVKLKKYCILIFFEKTITLLG
jgi:hypothetical protein